MGGSGRREILGFLGGEGSVGGGEFLWGLGRGRDPLRGSGVRGSGGALEVVAEGLKLSLRSVDTLSPAKCRPWKSLLGRGTQSTRPSFMRGIRNNDEGI